MTLGSMFAPVFAVLFVLSGEGGSKKPQVSLNKVSGSKIIPFEPYPSRPLVCVLSESHVLIRKEKELVRIDLTRAQWHENLPAKGESLSRYPIDTLDPPIV